MSNAQNMVGTPVSDTLSAVGDVYVAGGAGDGLINSTLQSAFTVRFGPGGRIETVKQDQAATQGVTDPLKVIEVDASSWV